MSEELEALCTTGRRAIRKRNFPKAIDSFRQAVELDPDNADAHEGLATACYLGNELDEAVTHFNRVTQLKPRDARAFINLGALYNQLKRHKEAADTLRKAIQRDGKSPDAYYNLGIAQKNLSQNAMAISAYRECIRLRPEMAEAHVNLANLYIGQNNLRKAKEHYQLALQANPDYAAAVRGINHVNALSEKNKIAANPFGRLVDENHLAKKGDAEKEIRQLTDEERFEDRRVLLTSVAESTDLAQQLRQTLLKQLEPALLQISRVMAQEIEDQQAMHDLRQQFRSAYKRSMKIYKALHGEITILRDHEKQMNE